MISPLETHIQYPNPTTQNWQVVAASVRGASHEKTGLPCQDVHRWHVLPNGILIAVVADGAGSAACAEVGAACAAQAVVDALTSHIAGRLAEKSVREDKGEDEGQLKRSLQNALLSARDAVEAEAAARELPSRELATTLIAVLATDRWVAAAQVGDGAVVAADENGFLHAVTVPPAAEYANETIFLVSPGAIETAQFAFHHGAVASVALFSDGLQRLALKLPEGAPHIPFFAPLFRFAAETADAELAHRQLNAFLTSPRITDRADDDLTLLLATLKDVHLA